MGVVVGALEPDAGSTLTATAFVVARSTATLDTVTDEPFASERKSPADRGAPVGGTNQSWKIRLEASRGNRSATKTSPPDGFTNTLPSGWFAFPNWTVRVPERPNDFKADSSAFRS